MTGDQQGADRKQLRVGWRSERGAINAVRTLFESHELVVDEVEGRSDYGRDLVVDITIGGALTGAVIGVQVKGNASITKRKNWLLPSSVKDITYWANSSVPVFGILWNPATGEMRWANLTAHARAEPRATVAVPFPESQLLTDATLTGFIDEAADYVRLTSPVPLLNLFDDDSELQKHAVRDCWTLGRSDRRAFVLLRRALPSMHGDSLRLAIATLSYLTPHPDIPWHSGNWIPEATRTSVRSGFQWSADELVHLVSAVEDESGDATEWQRGGLGQSLWCLLAEDQRLANVADVAIRLALDRDNLAVAFRLLVLAQARVADPLKHVHDLLQSHPGLRSNPMLPELIDHLERYGFMDVY